MSNSIIKTIGASGYSGVGSSGVSGYSGFSGGLSGYSGMSNSFSGYSGGGVGTSGYSGSGVSGHSGYSGSGVSGYSGYGDGTGKSGYSGYGGAGTSGFSGGFADWATWSPSITWGGTTPTVSGAVYRYTEIKERIIHFVVYFTIKTEGVSCTSAIISLPEYPKDIDAFIPVSAKTYLVPISPPVGIELASAVINATTTTGNLRLSGFNVTISETAFMVNGFYELAAK